MENNVPGRYLLTVLFLEGRRASTYFPRSCPRNCKTNRRRDSGWETERRTEKDRDRFPSRNVCVNSELTAVDDDGWSVTAPNEEFAGFHARWNEDRLRGWRCCLTWYEAPSRPSWSRSSRSWYTQVGAGCSFTRRLMTQRYQSRTP